MSITNNDEADYFYTSDFGCCVGLVSAGFKIIELDKTLVRKVRFGFARTQNLVKAVGDYRDYELSIDARTHFESSKLVKSLIYGDEL